MKKMPLAVGLFAFAFVQIGLAGDDSPEARRNWPQWRGPLANGVAPEADPPLEWSETKNVKWKVKVRGEGSSTPAIWGNQIFVLSAAATGKKTEAKPAETPVPAAANPPPDGERRGRDRAVPDVPKSRRRPTSFWCIA